jgi:putative membrane protein insertion efficiency factor
LKKDYFFTFLKGIDKLISGFFISLIRLYKKLLSPLLPPSCRFIPTCSEYAVQALQKYGPVKGLFLSCWRIIRCNPFCKGGYDPLK